MDRVRDRNLAAEAFFCPGGVGNARACIIPCPKPGPASINRGVNSLSDNYSRTVPMEAVIPLAHAPVLSFAQSHTDAATKPPVSGLVVVPDGPRRDLFGSSRRWWCVWRARAVIITLIFLSVSFSWALWRGLSGPWHPHWATPNLAPPGA